MLFLCVKTKKVIREKSLRVEGFAMVSEDGMVADAGGNMPDSLVIAADHAFLSDGLDNASVVVHGRNSHENQARSLRRLIATRKIESVDMIADQPQALLWNPDGLPFEGAVRMLGVWRGTVAILGGTEIFGLFLPRYDIFASRVP
jgi:hypothetical protein